MKCECIEGYDEPLVHCRGALPNLTDRLRALRIFSAKNVSAANGRYPLNSVGDPLPEMFMFQRWETLYCMEIAFYGKTISLMHNCLCTTSTLPCDVLSCMALLRSVLMLPASTHHGDLLAGCAVLCMRSRPSHRDTQPSGSINIHQLHLRG